MADDKPHVKEPRPEYTAQSATSPAVVEPASQAPTLPTIAQPATIITDPDLPKPWAPQPGESSMWYERFTIYRLLGPSRSVIDAYRQYQTISGRVIDDKAAQLTNPAGGWYAVAKRDKWRERALAWDVHLWWDKWEEREEELIRQGKRLRVYAASRAIAKSLEVIERVDVSKESLGAANATLKTGLREMRQDLEGSDRYVRHDVAVLMGEIPKEHLARLKKCTDKT